jgi:hypothetical protein
MYLRRQMLQSAAMAAQLSLLLYFSLVMEVHLGLP